MMRVVYCYEAKYLPHAGGFFDQPPTFVRLYMALLGHVAAREKQEADEMNARIGKNPEA